MKSRRGYRLVMRLRAEKNKLKIEHSIIDGLRPVLERLLRDNAGIRSIIPGVIRPVRDAKGDPVIRITVPVTNGWKAIATERGRAAGIVRQHGRRQGRTRRHDQKGFG